MSMSKPLESVLDRLRPLTGSLGLDPHGTVPGAVETWHPPRRGPWLPAHGLVVVLPPPGPIAPVAFEAARNARAGATVAGIWPSKTETAWYDAVCAAADYVAMSRGKVLDREVSTTVTLTSAIESVKVEFVRRFRGPDWRVYKVEL